MVSELRAAETSSFVMGLVRENLSFSLMVGWGPTLKWWSRL